MSLIRHIIHFSIRAFRFFVRWGWISLLSLGIFSLFLSSAASIWVIALTPFIVNGWLVTITRRGALDYAVALKNSLEKKYSKKHSDSVEKTDGAFHDKKEWLHQYRSEIRYGNNQDFNEKINSRSFFRWIKKRIITGFHDFKIGFRNWIGVWVWTLPGLTLMWFGWYAGWQVSFSKMYEYSAVGFTLTMAGWVLLASVMPLALMGMARYSLSGDWKIFFQARRNWRWIRRAGWRNLVIAAIFVISSLPFGIMYVVMYFWPDILMQAFPETFSSDADFSSDQVKLQVFLFYFGNTFLLLLPTWVVSRYLLGHYYYAPTLLKWLRLGRVTPCEISEGEIVWLEKCGFAPRKDITEREDQQQRGLWSKGITPPARISIILLSGVLWLAFSFLISLAQFARYSGLEGWFNHPLIHNPHFYYTPSVSDERSDSYNMKGNPAFQDEYPPSME